MAGHDVIRHMLPPALAVLLSVGIIGLLHKGGLAQLRDARNLAAFVPIVLLLSAACWWLFRPRPSLSEPKSRKPFWIWRAVAPLIAFLAGPGTVVILWAAVVYGFEREHYVTSHERVEELMAALPVGIVVGFVVSLLVFAWVASSD
jgi:hypothetical protein